MAPASSYAFLSAPPHLPSLPSPPKPKPSVFPLPSHLGGFSERRGSPLPLCFHRRHPPPNLPPDPPDDGPLKSLGLSAVFFSLALGFASSPLISRRPIALASHSPPAAVLQQELDQSDELLHNSRGLSPTTSYGFILSNFPSIFPFLSLICLSYTAVEYYIPIELINYWCETVHSYYFSTV